MTVDDVIRRAKRRGGYAEYEGWKGLLQSMNLTPLDYERAVRRLAEKVGV